MKFKRLVSLLLIGIMALSMVACGKTQTGVQKDENTDVVVEENVEGEENVAVEDTVDTEITEDYATVNPEFRDIIYEYFDTAFLNQELTNEKLEEFASGFASATNIPLDLVAVPVEEGVLTGFTSDITGFDNAYMFSPMIGSIPFVGYVFDLADGVDAEAFSEELRQSHDLRWNICTSADTYSLTYTEDVLLFVMHPNSFEIE